MVAMKFKILLPGLIGASLLIGGVTYTLEKNFQWPFFGANEDTEEVHVHSDFLFYINDSRVDLSDDKYQSGINGVRHEDFHLHDNDQNVLHRHAEGLTLVEFLASLDFTLTAECLTTDVGTEYCIDDVSQLKLYVNGETVSDPFSYIPQEEDRILLYYGTPENPNLAEYLLAISNEACIYSGTCPERGLPPPESCGLTCEI